MYALGGIEGGLENVEGTMDDMTKNAEKSISQDWKSIWREAKGAVLPLGEELIDFAKDILPDVKEGIKDVSDWFANLDEEGKKNILVLGGIAAAAGPVLTVFGHFATGTGTLIQLLGGLTRSIGVANGKGAAGALSLLSKGGVAGLAVAGITAVTLTVADLISSSKEAEEVNLDLAESLTDQASKLSDSANTFDELSKKAKISNEQLAELNDLNIRISESSNPGEIEKLQKQYDLLAENSGLSKDELKRLFDANKEIIEQAPNAKKSISEYGNAFVENTDAAREYINTLYEASLVELKAERVKQLEREKELMADLEKDIKTRNNLERELQYFLDAQNMTQDEIWDRQEEINDLYYHSNLSQEKKNELMREHGALQDALTGDLVKEIQKRQDKLEEQKKSVNSTQEELDKIRAMDEEMASIILKQVGINEETARQAIKNGEVASLLDDQVTALQKQKQELINSTDPAKQQEKSFKESIKAIDKQISGLKDAKGNVLELIDEAENYNEELSKDIDKNINAKTKPTATEINRELGTTISKTIRVNPALGRGITAISAYAKGTPPGGHPGGLAIVGDGGGSELIRTPDGKSFLSPPTDTLLGLPKGTHVIPHEKTKRLLKFTPKYAKGTRNWEGLFNLENANEFMKLLALVGKTTDASEIGSRVSTNININDNSEIVTLLQQLIVAVREGKNIIMDNREVGRVVEPIVTEVQERKKKVRESFV